MPKKAMSKHVSPQIEPYVPSWVWGYVYDSLSGEAIHDASVTLSGGNFAPSWTTQTDKYGYYFQLGPLGSYEGDRCTITASYPGYTTSSHTIIIAYAGYYQDLVLTPLAAAHRPVRIWPAPIWLGPPWGWRPGPIIQGPSPSPLISGEPKKRSRNESKKRSHRESA